MQQPRTIVLLVATTLLHVASAHPCDAEAMKACPFDGGKALGVCLNDPSKHEEKVEISAECTAFMQLHETCATEFAGGTCGGSAFTDDARLLGQNQARRAFEMHGSSISSKFQPP